MNDLTISIDGGSPVPVNGIVVFQNGVPIAVVKTHDNVVVYADAAREPHEVQMLVSSMGFKQQPVHRLIGKLEGSLGKS